MLQYNPSISGSLNITGSLIISNGMIGTVNGVDVQIFSSSINQVITGIQSTTGSQDGRLTSIETFTSSTSARLNSIETVSASNLNRLTALETTSASVDTLNTVQNTRLINLENKTGSLATTGSNTFYGTQTFSGSVYIANDLVVQGSSSIQYITGSSVNIGTNIVQLNTANPSVRYAGLSIIDSGSIGGSGSFLYDSVQDEFIFVHRGDGTNVTSSHFVLGPETYNDLGNETYLINNRLPKGTGKEHLVDSNIFDNGTTICLTGNTIGTGTACFGSSITGTTLYGATVVCSPSVLSSGTICSSGNNCIGANLYINGCIGIGNSSPGRQFSIKGANEAWSENITTATNTQCWLYGQDGVRKGFEIYDLNTSSTRFFISPTTGNIGVGNVTPCTLFEVRCTLPTNCNGPVACSHPIATFSQTDSGNGNRGLQFGIPTQGISGPAYIKVNGTGARFSIINQSNCENFTVFDTGVACFRCQICVGGTTLPNDLFALNFLTMGG